MAVKKSTDNNTNQTQAQTEAPRQEAPQAQAAPQGRRSLADLNAHLGGAMTQRSAGESVRGFQEAFDRILDAELESNYRNVTKITVIDSNVHRLAKSAVVFTLKAGNMVAAHTLMVSGSGEPLQSHSINTGNGIQRSIAAVAGDMYDDHWWAVLERHVQSIHGGNVEVVDAGVATIPSMVTLDSEMALRSIAFHAITAVDTTVKQRSGQAVKLSADYLNTGERLACRVDYNADDATTAAGLPIRSDVKLSLNGLINTDRNSVSAMQTIPLSEVDAYVDLVYSPAAPINSAAMQNPYAPQQMHDARTYAPRLVMTGVKSKLDVVTLEAQLLAISTTTILSQEGGWKQLFKPTYSRSKGLNLRDIGAVGHEFNPTGAADFKYQAIKTGNDKFGDAEFYQLMGLAFFDNLIYSINIEEAGDQSWCQRVFRWAAEGQQAAVNLIIDAANTLTNGEFGKLYDGDNPFLPQINRIHTGVYKDANGVHDIQDLDYLAMLNIWGDKDRELVARFGNTFDCRNPDTVGRLEEREQIIRNTFETAEFTGYALQLTFRPEFIAALAGALRQAGVHYTAENVILGGAPQQRGDTSVQGYGLAAGNIGGIWGFNQGPGYTGGSYHMGPRNGGYL